MMKRILTAIRDYLVLLWELSDYPPPWRHMPLVARVPLFLVLLVLPVAWQDDTRTTPVGESGEG